MPIHEYRCKSCGEVREHLVGVTARQEELACPECGSLHLSRTLSLFSVNVKSAKSVSVGDCSSCEQVQGGHSCCGGACSH